jgi:hypothetical protein
LRIVELLLTEQQTLVLRMEALRGQDGPAVLRERANLQGHMASHARDLDRLFAELGLLVPPEERPA